MLQLFPLPQPFSIIHCFILLLLFLSQSYYVNILACARALHSPMCRCAAHGWVPPTQPNPNPHKYLPTIGTLFPCPSLSSRELDYSCFPMLEKVATRGAKFLGDEEGAKGYHWHYSEFPCTALKKKTLHFEVLKSKLQYPKKTPFFEQVRWA